MKIKLSGAEVAEFIEENFQLRGYTVTDVIMSKYGEGEAEILLEKSPMDQGLTGGASGNKLAGLPPPTTPPFVGKTPLFPDGASSKATHFDDDHI